MPNYVTAYQEATASSTSSLIWGLKESTTVVVPDSATEQSLNMYTQRQFQLKFSALLKAYDVKFTENSKNITFKDNSRL